MALSNFVFPHHELRVETGNMIGGEEITLVFFWQPLQDIPASVSSCKSEVCTNDERQFSTLVGEFLVGPPISQIGTDDE